MCEIINRDSGPRDINVITVEIKTLFKQAQNIALSYAIEIGRRLTEAKSVLPHGTWGAWLSENFEFSQSTANNFMKLFDEYGSDQSSLFGAVPKSQTFANLPYSKALQLLSLSEDDRESFIKNNDVDRMSVRELKQAIDTANSASDVLKAQVQDLSNRLNEANKAIEDYKGKSRDADREALNSELELTDAKKEIKRLESELNDATVKNDELANQLDESIKNPKVSQDIIDDIKNKAQQEAQNEFSKAKEKYIAEADKRVSEADKRAAEANEKLAAVSKSKNKNTIDNPHIVEFKCMFDQLQVLSGKLINSYNTIKSESPDVGNKLKTAFEAFINSVNKRMD